MKQTSVIEQLSALYTNALDKVFSHINTVLTQISMSYIVSLLTIYFLLMGYKFIIGDIDTAKKNIFRVFVYLPLMMTLVLNYDMYLEMIVIPTMTLKVYVVELINNIGSATTNGNNFKQLDVIFNNMYNFATNNYWSSNFIYSAKEHIMGWLVIIVYGLLYVTIAYYLLKSLVATSLFLMIGIIPLLFFAFDGTKSITAAWFKALVTYWLYAPISAFFMIFIYWVSHATSTNLNTDFSSFFFNGNFRFNNESIN